MEILIHAALGQPLGYMSPDQIPPIASALAGVMGVLLMFWQRIVAMVRAAFGRVLKAFRGAPKE